MPPSLQVMAPVSASSDYHQSWIYHTGGASLWGWMVPYAIFKGRNTLRRAGRDDVIERVFGYVDGEYAQIRKTPLGLNFTRRKIYHFLDKALETGTDSKPPR